MKLLIAGIRDISHETLQKISDLGHSATIVQDERIPLPEQGLNPADFEGVICNGLFLYNDIADFSSLRYIQLISAGYDRVPLEAIEARGIEIHNARGVYDIPMAEWALCGVLQLYKRSVQLRENQTHRTWSKERNVSELNGKTACIVGCGSVGSACARLFGAVGCRVIGANRTVREDALYEKVYALGQIDQALSESDIVILALPAHVSTHHLIGAERLDACKPGAVVVNIGRGSVLDSQAVALALMSGRLAGAVLDVFETEPLPMESPLWTLDNAIITPHNSFVGEGNALRLEATILENLKNYGHTTNSPRE